MVAGNLEEGGGAGERREGKLDFGGGSGWWERESDTLRPPGSLACGAVWGMDTFGEGVRSLAVGVSHGSHQEQCHRQEDESVVLGTEVWTCRRGWLKDRLKG